MRGRPRGASPVRREPRAPSRGRRHPRWTPSPRSKPKDTDHPANRSSASAEQQSEQRFGSAARRAAILAAVICVLTLTIAGPVRTYFGQRTEMKQLKADRGATARADRRPRRAEGQARRPGVHRGAGARAARIRDAGRHSVPGAAAGERGCAGRSRRRTRDRRTPTNPGTPSLWHTIADAPHGVSPHRRYRTAPPQRRASPGG